MSKNYLTVSNGSMSRRELAVRSAALSTMLDADYGAAVTRHCYENVAGLVAVEKTIAKAVPDAASELQLITRSYVARCALDILLD